MQRTEPISSLSPAISCSEEPACPFQWITNDDLSAREENEMVAARKLQVQEDEERIYSAISENSGKFTFIELLGILGGPSNKKMLYGILSKLARRGKITRIRGIGEKRIEFYYCDTKKIRKVNQSPSATRIAARSF